MIRQYVCDRDTSDALRAAHINEIRAELAAQVIARSDIDHASAITLVIKTKKVRDRSKTSTTDRYIITAHLHV